MGCDVYAVLSDLNPLTTYVIDQHFGLSYPDPIHTYNITTDANGDAHELIQTVGIDYGPFWLETTHNGQLIGSPRVTADCPTGGEPAVSIYFFRTADPGTCEVLAEFTDFSRITTYTVEWWKQTEDGTTLTVSRVLSMDELTNSVGTGNVDFGPYPDDIATEQHWIKIVQNGETISSARKPGECDPPPSLYVQSHFVSGDLSSCDVHLGTVNLDPNQTYTIDLVQSFVANGNESHSSHVVTTNAFGDANERVGFVGLTNNAIVLTITTTHNGQVLTSSPARNCGNGSEP
jgi:hypothetical protein